MLLTKPFDVTIPIDEDYFINAISPVIIGLFSHYWHIYNTETDGQQKNIMTFLEMAKENLEPVFYKTNIPFVPDTSTFPSNDNWDDWYFQTMYPEYNQEGLVYEEFEVITQEEFIKAYKAAVMKKLETVKGTPEEDRINVLRFNKLFPEVNYLFGIKAKDGAFVPKIGNIVGTILFPISIASSNYSFFKFSKNIDFWFDLTGGFFIKPYARLNPYNFIRWDGKNLHFKWLNFFYSIDKWAGPFFRDESTLGFTGVKTIGYLEKLSNEVTISPESWIIAQEDNETWANYKPKSVNIEQIMEFMFDKHEVYWKINDDNSIDGTTIKVVMKPNDIYSKYIYQDTKEAQFGLVYNPEEKELSQVLTYDEVNNYKWSRIPNLSEENWPTITPLPPIPPVHKPNLWADGTMPTIIAGILGASIVIGIPVGIIIWKYRRRK